jgi:chemotaxis protein MotB
MGRHKEKAHGGHGWFVTFADLMGLLVSFFVMLVAFSDQDARKMQAVTGSMREAFGVQSIVHSSGLTETDGLTTRPKLKNVDHIRPEESSITPTPDEQGTDVSHDQSFALAVASLRQALQAMPELTEASKHIELQETGEGLDIELVDQDGRAMFPENSREPYQRVRIMVQRLAPVLKAIPYRISIVGYTTGAGDEQKSGEEKKWTLAVARANAIRAILEDEGYPTEDIYQVAGKADTDPLLAEDPSLAPNRRVTITLRRELPPAPPDLTP